MSSRCCSFAVSTAFPLQWSRPQSHPRHVQVPPSRLAPDVRCGMVTSCLLLPGTQLEATAVGSAKASLGHGMNARASVEGSFEPQLSAVAAAESSDEEVSSAADVQSARPADYLAARCVSCAGRTCTEHPRGQPSGRPLTEPAGEPTSTPHADARVQRGWCTARNPYACVMPPSGTIFNTVRGRQQRKSLPIISQRWWRGWLATIHQHSHSSRDLHKHGLGLGRCAQDAAAAGQQ